MNLTHIILAIPITFLSIVQQVCGLSEKPNEIRDKSWIELARAFAKSLELYEYTETMCGVPTRRNNSRSRVYSSLDGFAALTMFAPPRLTSRRIIQCFNYGGTPEGAT